MVQTILGSGGAIGIPLAKELKQYTSRIRLVSRNPQKVNESDELFPADLTNPAQVDQAIAGSEVVYVTVGFPYNRKVWQALWPPFIRNVIQSCAKHGAKLVFFDNIYMYAASSVPFMTEEAPIDPPGVKGRIREEVRKIVLDAVARGEITGLIARAADFYGPHNRNSLLAISVADNLRKGKKAQVFGDPSRVHTFTFTPDAARATALLGNTPDAYGQEWHLPTTREKISMLGWIDLVAKALKAEPKVQVVPGWMVSALGLFIPIMREFPEMLYQYDRDYVFDSSKFEKRFGIFATPPDEGIRLTFHTA